MTLTFELYSSFRSPYSYLATSRYVDLVSRFDVGCALRPVYPIAVREPDFFQRVNPMWPPYLLRDTKRIADVLEIPYGWPQPDPIVQDVVRGVIAKDQPYIHRLTRLGIAAVERDRGLPFIDAVSRMIWSGTVKDWHNGDHLSNASAEADLDLTELDAAIETDPDHFESAISANQEALAGAGHWGVPTAVLDGEPFFGQDRIEHLLWRLKQKGLKERT
jgi:2-hydroxychromene-2-carboxylate isomerase